MQGPVEHAKGLEHYPKRNRKLLKGFKQEKDKIKFVFKRVMIQGAWVVQSAKRLTLGFGTGRYLRVLRLSPHLALR